MQQLPKNTLLQGGKYKIENVLGQGGFGITYLASQKISIEGPIGQIETEIMLAIKEFFMKDVCNREEDSNIVSIPSVGSKQLAERFKQKFIKEAWNISKLKHPHIIKVVDVFEENDTAYYVMEYHGNGSLNSRIKHNGAMAEEEATKYILQIADALDYIHKQQMNHLDIKPDNVLLNNKGEAVLIDFGLSKCYDADGEQTSSTPIGVSVGYAPLEQSRIGGVGTFSPATDIYSLGATFYKLVTGQTPPDASEVLDEGLPDMPDSVSQKVQYAITQAMEARRKKRPQSIEEFLNLLGTNSLEPKEKLQEKKIVIQKVVTKPVFVDKEVEKVIKNIVDTSDLEETVLINTLDENYKEVNALLSNEGFKNLDSVEAVDLGLSVKWANVNWNSQAVKWCTKEADFSALDNISATDFDPVFISTNKQYRIPTLQEWLELRQKCKWEWINHNLISGYVVIGSNGNKIFLPALGKVIGCNQIGDKLKGYYWTSNKRSGRKDVYYIYFNPEQVDYECEPLENVLRWVRAVEVND